MRAQLIPLEGGEPVEILKEMTLVGRREDCDLRLDHKSVSKLHCVLVKADGLLLLRDLGSTNGTRVNDQRVRRAALLPNDKLTIAGHSYRVHLGGAELPPSPEECTQQIDAKDLALLQKPLPDAEDSAADIPILQVQRNVLPDNYPEDEQKK